jgi:hypothetical protein
MIERLMLQNQMQPQPQLRRDILHPLSRVQDDDAFRIVNAAQPGVAVPRKPDDGAAAKGAGLPSQNHSGQAG